MIELASYLTSCLGSECSRLDTLKGLETLGHVEVTNIY